MNYFYKVLIFINLKVLHFKLPLYFLFFMNSSPLPPSLFHKEGGDQYLSF